MWLFFRNLKIMLSGGPAITFLGIYLKVIKSTHKRNTHILMHVVAILSIVKTWKEM